MRCLNCHQDGLPLDTEICPSCNVHIQSLMRDVLPPASRLRAGTYQIDYALGRGSFGVTYRGHHTLLEQLVAIKEFFPKTCALRNPTTVGFTIPWNQGEVFQKWPADSIALCDRYERELV